MCTFGEDCYPFMVPGSTSPRVVCVSESISTTRVRHMISPVKRNMITTYVTSVAGFYAPQLSYPAALNHPQHTSGLPLFHRQPYTSEESPDTSGSLVHTPAPPLGRLYVTLPNRLLLSASTANTCQSGSQCATNINRASWVCRTGHSWVEMMHC